MAEVKTHDPIPLDTFGARLAIVRQYLGGWNVTRAANACGIDDQTWRNWEAGRNPPRDYPRICQIISDSLGIDYTWLMVGGSLRSRCASLARTWATTAMAATG